MPIPPKSLSRVFHTVPAKAALAVGGAALASGAALVFPAAASAASHSADSANLVIFTTHSHVPFPSMSFPGLPGTSYPTAGNPTVISVGRKKSAAPSPSSQGQFSYVSTFSPAPVAPTPPPNTASAACLANGQPVAGPGGDLDLPGISGVSRDAGHAGALPITGLGPTEMLPPQIDSANLGQLKVTRPVDATSANLSMVASSGYRFPCVHMEIGAGNGFANAEYALVNAGLVADDRSGTTETLTWTYSTILWTYTLPGSTAVHQGSGQINAQPNRTSTSLAKDSKLVAAGTIGLTLLVALALLTLYVVGRRRSRARYRARYYRRTAQRAQREAMAAAIAPVLRPTMPAEPAEIWEPQTGDTLPFAEAAEAYEPIAAAAPPRAAKGEDAGLPEAAEDEESEPEPEPTEAGEPVAPVERTHPEAESTESESAESEAAAPEGPEPEAAESESVESEAAESEAAESESVEPELAAVDSAESESARPPEPTEPEAVEPEAVEPAETAEPGADDLAAAEEAAPAAESEEVIDSEQKPESEAEPTAQEDGGAARDEQEAESEEDAESPASPAPQAAEATEGAASAETADESPAEPARTRLTGSAKPSGPKSRTVSGDEHEPAAAR